MGEEVNTPFKVQTECNNEANKEAVLTNEVVTTLDENDQGRSADQTSGTNANGIDDNVQGSTSTKTDDVTSPEREGNSDKATVNGEDSNYHIDSGIDSVKSDLDKIDDIKEVKKSNSTSTLINNCKNPSP